MGGQSTKEELTVFAHQEALLRLAKSMTQLICVTEFAIACDTTRRSLLPTVLIRSTISD